MVCHNIYFFLTSDGSGQKESVVPHLQYYKNFVFLTLHIIKSSWTGLIMLSLQENKKLVSVVEVLAVSQYAQKPYLDTLYHNLSQYS